jgi:hypothetical protein
MAWERTAQTSGACLAVGGIPVGAYASTLFPQFGVIGFWGGAAVVVFGLGLLTLTLLPAPENTVDRRGSPGDRMWLSEALRYLARDSYWSSRQPLHRDTWPQKTAEEFLGALSTGAITAYGRRYKPTRETAPRDIDREFWRRISGFDAFGLMADNSTKHGLHSENGEAYTEVYLSKEAVRTLWRSRSLWARLLRQSPPEQWETDKHWAAQDAKFDSLEREILDGLTQRLDGS